MKTNQNKTIFSIIDIEELGEFRYLYCDSNGLKEIKMDQLSKLDWSKVDEFTYMDGEGKIKLIFHNSNYIKRTLPTLYEQIYDGIHINEPNQSGEINLRELTYSYLYCENEKYGNLETNSVGLNELPNIKPKIVYIYQQPFFIYIEPQ